MQWILLAAFIILPFGLLSFGSFNRGQIITLIISAFAVLAIRVKPLSLRLFCWYVAGWTAYRHVYKVYGDPHFGPAPEPALDRMFVIMAGAIMYLAVTESDLLIKWFFLFIGGMAVFQALIGLGQTLGYNPVFDFLASKTNTKQLFSFKPTGTLGNQDFLLAYIAITLPLFYRKWRVLALPLFAYLLITAKVSTAVIAAFIGTAVYFGRNLKWLMTAAIPCLAGIIIYVVFIDQIPLKNVRFEMWGIALDQFKTWPQILFGFGPGSRWGGKGALHNDWLSIFHTFGLIGLSCIVAFVWDTIKRVKDDRTMLAMIITICVNALGNLPMQLAPSIFLILIIFGLAQREVVNG